MDTFGALLIVLLALALWMLPLIIAALRGHPQIAPIAVVTVLLSWTVIGWIIALAWSFQAQRVGEQYR